MYNDTLDDLKRQLSILDKANYSLAILGAAFVRHGSGQFVSLRPPDRGQDIKLLRERIKRMEGKNWK